jgi:sigma-B regulation protein RsbU (phosphoserine phosphatase)
MNRDLARSTLPEQFATAFLARLDPAAGTMQYVSAGHPAPLLIHRGAEGGRKRIGILGGKGYMLGIDESLPFVEQVCPFEAGDRLVFYTDGLVEVEREDRQYLGEEGLVDICAELPADGELAADWIIEQTVAFNHPAAFADDVTLVVLDRNG